MRVMGRVMVVAEVIAVGAVALTIGAQAAGAGASPGWRLVKYFGACQSDGVLSVAATGARDAWATGQAYRFQCDRPSLLIARWDGRSWRDMTPPPGFAGVSADALGTSVAALSGSYAWAFVNRAVSPSRPTDSFALLWRDGRWRPFRLTPGARVTSAAVFSPSNAWAVGFIGDSRYAARFNGTRWRRVPIPVRAAAAAFAAPRNIWVVGPQRPLALAHWTGRWQTIPLPPGLAPSGGFIDHPWVVSDGSRGAWVALTVQLGGGRDRNIGGVLLHWTGSKWENLTPRFPTLGLGPLSPDGHGGIWIASSSSTSSVGCPSCDINAMFHFRQGVWSKTPVNVPGLTVTAMRLVPGTNSVWASGTNVPVPGGQGDAVGVMLKYGP
jgi:hypothetical protein